MYRTFQGDTNPDTGDTVATDMGIQNDLVCKENYNKNVLRIILLLR